MFLQVCVFKESYFLQIDGILFERFEISFILPELYYKIHSNVNEYWKIENDLLLFFWESRFTIRLNAVKIIDYTKKTLQTKLVQNSISYKKLSECLSNFTEYCESPKCPHCYNNIDVVQMLHSRHWFISKIFTTIVAYFYNS